MNVTLELLLCQLFILKFSYYKNLNKVSKLVNKVVVTSDLGEATPKWVLAKDEWNDHPKVDEDIGYIPDID